MAYATAMYSFNIQWLANFIPSIATAMVMILVGQFVIRGQVTFPAFVVFLNTMNQLGPTLSAVFMDIFQINKGYASIMRIANLLNSDTRRKSLHRIKKRRESLIHEYQKDPNSQDWNNVDIVVHNVSYFFPSQPSSIILSRVSFRIEAGQVLAIGGGSSVGKKCMLKLLARHYSPINGGFIEYPANWRVRFIDSNSNFFGGDNLKLSKAKRQSWQEVVKVLHNSTGTLIYNLKFGCQHNHENESQFDVEIYHLLKLLGVSKELIGKSVEEFTIGNQAKKYTNIGLNGEKLSQTDQILLTIARALLSSVDLLLISNLLDILDIKKANEILIILKDFVANRGMVNIIKSEPNSKLPWILRKKKTVIFSTKIPELESQGDNWIHLTGHDDLV
jgi:ABC-type multidrug transport system fused ATPase/permease subunit